MSHQLNLNTETVEAVASENPVSVTGDTAVREVLRQMKDQRRGAVLVCHDEKLAGIFTERDALKLMASGASLDVAIDQVMTANPETLSESDTVGTAISKMSRGGYRRMPILDAEQRPKGFVKVAGILHYLVQHFPGIVYNLPPDPHHATQEREGA